MRIRKNPSDTFPGLVRQGKPAAEGRVANIGGKTQQQRFMTEATGTVCRFRASLYLCYEARKENESMKQEKACRKCLFWDICPYTKVCSHYTPLDYDSSEAIADRIMLEEKRRRDHYGSR